MVIKAVTECIITMITIINIIIQINTVNKKPASNDFIYNVDISYYKV